jgi:hypothetical protein
MDARTGFHLNADDLKVYNCFTYYQSTDDVGETNVMISGRRRAR